MHGQQNFKCELRSINLYSRINFHIFLFKVKNQLVLNAEVYSRKIYICEYLIQNIRSTCNAV